MGDKADSHDIVWPTLAGHAVGALSAPLARQADEHLVDCEQCRGRLADYSATMELVVVGQEQSELARRWDTMREQMRRQGGPQLTGGDSERFSSP
jgi:hypothetical protein